MICRILLAVTLEQAVGLKEEQRLLFFSLVVACSVADRDARIQPRTSADVPTVIGSVGASGCERFARGGRICEGIFALVPPAFLESLRAYFREFAVARLWISKGENVFH